MSMTETSHSRDGNGGAAAASSDAGNAVAELLIAAGAIHVSRMQPYILAAGWASPVYVDCRLLVGEPSHRNAVTELAVKRAGAIFAQTPFDAIVGAETAGIPFACWLAERMDLKFRYVRKRPLGIGRHAQIEGGSVEGLSVLMVDDLTTDGSSKLAFARGLRAANATVEHVLTIFYHNAFPGAEARLQQAGLQLHSLATWADILRADRGAGLPTEDRAEIERFLRDPVAWSTQHGGRSSIPPRS